MIEKRSKVTNMDGKIGNSIVYVAKKEMTGKNLKPSREYLSHLLAGGFYLSDNYFDKLRKIKCV